MFRAFRVVWNSTRGDQSQFKLYCIPQCNLHKTMNTTHEFILDFLLFTVDLRPGTIVVSVVLYARKIKNFVFSRRPKSRNARKIRRDRSLVRFRKTGWFIGKSISICRYRFPNFFIGRVVATKPKPRCSFMVFRFIDLRKTGLCRPQFCVSSSSSRKTLREPCISLHTYGGSSTLLY